jgi:hypothetical protein
MAGSDLAVDAVLVVCTIAGQRSEGTINLVEQGTDLRAVIDIIGGQRRRDDPAVSASTPMCSLRHDRRRLVPCFSINHSPAPDSFNPVLSTNRCTGSALDRSPATASVSARRLSVEWSGIETEQADDGADQPFGLPQSQAEHGAQRQRRRDRQGRIAGLTAPCGPWFCARPRSPLR